jgi:hypothetical protein
MRPRHLLSAAVAAAVVLVLGAGGAAVAFVTGGGRGNGAAVVSSPDGVRAVAVPVAGVYPGGPASVVRVSVTNALDRPFTVSGLVPDPEVLPDACPGPAWRITVPEDLPTVPPVGSAVIPVGVALEESAPAECQGLQLTLDLAVSGRLG